MKLFGKEKDHKGVRRYFFGIKVYERRMLPHARKIYVFGVRIKKKRYVKKKSSMLLRYLQKNFLWVEM